VTSASRGAARTDTGRFAARRSTIPVARPVTAVRPNRGYGAAAPAAQLEGGAAGTAAGNTRGRAGIYRPGQFSRAYGRRRPRAASPIIEPRARKMRRSHHKVCGTKLCRAAESPSEAVWADCASFRRRSRAKAGTAMPAVTPEGLATSPNISINRQIIFRGPAARMTGAENGPAPYSRDHVPAGAADRRCPGAVKPHRRWSTLTPGAPPSAVAAEAAERPRQRPCGVKPARQPILNTQAYWPARRAAWGTSTTSAPFCDVQDSGPPW
jgi:hypothetical protein